jgi:AcrR family transcriptional regulator
MLLVKPFITLRKALSLSGKSSAITGQQEFGMATNSFTGQGIKGACEGEKGDSRDRISPHRSPRRKNSCFLAIFRVKNKFKSLRGRKVSMARRITKRQSTSLRRKQIIDALRKLIIEYGSENVTVRRIAKEIGVSQGAIYRHFKSKRQILDFLVDYIEENLIGDVEKSDSNAGTLEILENILKSHISAIEQRKGVSFLIVAEIVSLGDKRLNKKIYEVLNNYIKHIKDVLLRGVKSGEIRPDIDAAMAATVFLGIIQGLVTLWALSNYNFTLEEKYFGLWDFFRKSVRHQSA